MINEKIINCSHIVWIRFQNVLWLHRRRSTSLVRVSVV